MQVGTWFQESRQTWKLGVFLFLAIGTVCLVALSLAGDLLGRSSPLSSLATISASAVTFAWLCTSVRCPRCKGRPIWRILRSASSSAWLVAIVSMEKCPICGERPDLQAFGSG